MARFFFRTFLILFFTIAQNRILGEVALNKWCPKTLVGIYKYGRESIYINADFTFLIKRTPQRNDVVANECNDTIAKGIWQKVKDKALRLTNSSDFGKIDYDVKQQRMLSADSVYIQILLPNDDAFFNGRFEYDFFFFSGIGHFQSYKNVIALSKQLVSGSGNINFSFSVKDEFPNCEQGRRCYQRIYFGIFDNFLAKIGMNSFTISLNNFNECYVERMDLDNEILLIDGNELSWRGRIYRRT